MLKIKNVINTPAYRTVILMLLGLIIIKKYIFNRFTSINQVEKMIKDGKYRKLIIGNILLIALPAGKEWHQYNICSMYPKQPINIFKLAEASKVKDITGMVPTES